LQRKEQYCLPEDRRWKNFDRCYHLQVLEIEEKKAQGCFLSAYKAFGPAAVRGVREDLRQK